MSSINVMGNVVGPLIWLGFVAVVVWFTVRSAVLARRERRGSSSPRMPGAPAAAAPVRAQAARPRRRTAA